MRSGGRLSEGSLFKKSFLSHLWFRSSTLTFNQSGGDKVLFVCDFGTVTLFPRHRRVLPTQSFKGNFSR